MSDFIECPEPGCGFDAAVVDRWVADGSPGPVEMLKVRCPRSHWFCSTADRLAPV